MKKFLWMALLSASSISMVSASSSDSSSSSDSDSDASSPRRARFQLVVKQTTQTHLSDSDSDSSSDLVAPKKKVQQGQAASDSDSSSDTSSSSSSSSASSEYMKPTKPVKPAKKPSKCIGKSRCGGSGLVDSSYAFAFGQYETMPRHCHTPGKAQGYEAFTLSIGGHDSCLKTGTWSTMFELDGALKKSCGTHLTAEALAKKEDCLEKAYATKKEWLALVLGLDTYAQRIKELQAQQELSEKYLAWFDLQHKSKQMCLAQEGLLAKLRAKQKASCSSKTHLYQQPTRCS